LIGAAHRVYLSIGSNLGDKEGQCNRALSEIKTRGVGRILARSPYYRTEPVDYLDQDWFVNGAVELETGLEPRDLLKQLQAIQIDLGTAVKTVRFGPRAIDLDILLYDDRIITEKDLVVPHERMQDRAFVLIPLCDIAPDLVHPVFKMSMAALLAALDTAHQGVLPL
jgi:2-amino-4-hydroxy-6-hydroxymethyldihydropteridine diphosphokinase